MLRRSSIVSMKLTHVLRAGVSPPIIYMDGGKEWGMHDAKDAPPADNAEGVWWCYTGIYKLFRILDPVWALRRTDYLNRYNYIGCWFQWWSSWVLFWYIPMKWLYGEGAPPEVVDWNDEQAGYLAETSA